MGTRPVQIPWRMIEAMFPGSNCFTRACGRRAWVPLPNRCSQPTSRLLSGPARIGGMFVAGGFADVRRGASIADRADARPCEGSNGALRIVHGHERCNGEQEQ
jgi:hypothetical protein